MKLLFDQHLSFRLVNRLADIFTGSSHVMLHGLDQADDTTVWEFARTNGFTVVTRDSDFNDLTLLRHAPPKIVWIRVGNCTTTQIEELIRRHQQAIEQLELDESGSILVLT